jgi:hypothetical protein
MAEIHLIERVTNVKITNKEKNEWDSYAWVIAPDTAEKLVGGEIYLHKAQDKPSHFGGKILSYRILGPEFSSDSGRIVFNFKAGLEYKDVKTDKEGWGMEKKIVW